MAYGMSDFLGGLMSRRGSPWAIALLAQIVSAAAVTVAAVTVAADLTTADLAWGPPPGSGAGWAQRSSTAAWPAAR
ncbi:hypothetical protein BH18ACT7_BH18ACT7_22220 [soil metagenome]